MNTATQDFGRRLRTQRERLGIPLAVIADSTKIARSLLADLERGKLSRWPGGIYRRAFVREYSTAIGLPADVVLAEFLELFPEEGSAPPARAVVEEPVSELRLTLDENRAYVLIGVGRRVSVALLELAAVLGLGSLLAPVTGTPFWTVCGAIALTYYPIAAALSRRQVSIFKWPLRAPRFTAGAGFYDVPSSRELIRLVLHQPPVQGADERPA